jgi:ribosomal protein L11 methyltransferase
VGSRAIRLSPNVLVYPAGSEAPQGLEGKLALPYLPSAAFGDGSHPTTRLCAGVLDQLCRQKMPRAVLDVGTGTGILARIARARGAHDVIATDIDPIALLSATENAALDSHPGEFMISDAAPDHWGPRFDLVVANILEGPLRTLAPALATALSSGGVLLLSGFTPIQIPSLRVVFTAQGLDFVTESLLDEWALLMFRRRPS